MNGLYNFVISVVWLLVEFGFMALCALGIWTLIQRRAVTLGSFAAALVYGTLFILIVRGKLPDVLTGLADGVQNATHNGGGPGGPPAP